MGLAKHAHVEVISHSRENEDRFPFPNVYLIKHYEHAILGKVLEFWNSISPFQLNSFAKTWAGVINEKQPDAIIIPFGTIAERVLEYHDFSNDIPVLIIFHGYDASSELSKPSYCKALKKLTQQKNVHAAFVSNNMRTRMQDKGFHFPNNSVLYCGVNIERFQRKSRHHPREPYVFLQVSSFAEKKGHGYTLHAYAKFLATHPEMKQKTILKIGGDGEKAAILKQMTYSLGIEDNIDFIGWVSVAENVELMEEAHCFLHHSITDNEGNKEGIPTVMMEAMAMELPIISTLHSGIPELVEEGVNGFLVAEKDVNAYAKRMKDVMDKFYLAENREKIRQLFEEGIHDKNLKELLDNQIVNKHK
jgi:colanic acid/amylovoran biosynthesis glycosyltransferase